MIKRVFIYLLGFLLIAVGINFSKMAGLGISPVSSVPRALEVIFGFTLGTMVIIIYCFLVLCQFLVLGKDFKLINILGIPTAIVFGWMVDLVGIDPKAFGHLLYGFPIPKFYPVKVLYLVFSMIFIAIGVYTYLKANLIPMPGEGLAKAIAQKTGKSFGDCKTIVDSSLIALALILQLIFLDGFASFYGQNVVVREGTILSAVLIGQIIKLISKYAQKPVKHTEKEETT